MSDQPKQPGLGLSDRVVRRPFKGYFCYEWQVGSLVFQWRHGSGQWKTNGRWKGLRLGTRLFVWHDPMWRR